MKKIITLLLAMTMILSLAISVNAANVATGINVNWTEDGDIVEVTVSAVGLAELSGLTIGIKYPTGLTPVLFSDKTTAVVSKSTEVTDFAEILNTSMQNADLWDSGQVTILSTPAVKFQIASSSQKINATASTDLYKIYFKNDGSVTVGDSTFSRYYSTMNQTSYTNGTTTVKLDADSKIGFTYVPGETPDNTIVGKDAKGTPAAGAISFTGKIRADLIGNDYGVIANGKKFAGAKVGDTVANNTVVEMSGKAFDGTFQIDLTNIFEKLSVETLDVAGSFYVGNETQAYTTVTVNK